MGNVFIKDVRIEKVRHLHDIDISLSEDDGAIKHLILTGKNGSGKTSVLDAIAGCIDAVCRDECPSEKKLAGSWCGVDLVFNMSDADVHALYEAGDCVFAHFSAHRSFKAAVPTSIEKVTFADRYGIEDSPRELFVKYLLDLKMMQALAAVKGKENLVAEIQAQFKWPKGPSPNGHIVLKGGTGDVRHRSFAFST